MKKFSDFSETMTAGDAGIPQDTVDMGSKKKRAPVTRRYIEIMGKKRIQQKEEVEVDEAKIPSNYLQIAARAKKKAKKAALAKAKPAKQEYEYSTHSTGIQKNGKKETIVVKHGRDPKAADAAHKNISKDSFSRHILNRKPVKEATINPTDGKSTGSDSSVKQVKSKADFMKGRKDPAKNRVKESVEQVDELSQGLKKRYINRAAMSAASNAHSDGISRKLGKNKHKDKVLNRLRGINRATKEEVEQVDELSTKLLKRYDRKNATSGANLRKKMNKTADTVRKSASGYATPKQAARFTKAMDKHSNRMDGADRSQQIQLKRAQKESVEQVDEVIGSAIGLAVGAHAVHRAAKKMAHGHGVDSTKKTTTDFAKNFGKAVVNPKDYVRTGKDVAKGIKSTAQSLRKKMKKESVMQEGLAVKSGNEGGGYYNTSHNVKHGGNETKTKSGYAKTHADVKKHTGGEDTHVRDYLDSKRGRHLVGKEQDKGYIKKDFAKFSKTYKASDYKWS